MFRFDLESIIFKTHGLEEWFIIQYFDFSSNNTIDFKELGRFNFERFLKEYKVPKFEVN